MIVSLLYLTTTWPDIQFTVGLCGVFRLPYALHIGRQSSEFSGISNIILTLRFGILLLIRWIFLVFLMLILRAVELTERALL
jgi:hypothetical protein